LRKPLSSAERQARWRARRRGEHVPMGRPGRPRRGPDPNDPAAVMLRLLSDAELRAAPKKDGRWERGTVSHDTGGKINGHARTPQPGDGHVAGVWGVLVDHDPAGRPRPRRLDGLSLGELRVLQERLKGHVDALYKTLPRPEGAETAALEAALAFRDELAERLRGLGG
jgi:hypothetical protein